MNLILFGFKGAGKTYFGKKLATSLGRPFIDTDDLIVELHAAETGERLPPRELYRTLGREGFRQLEKQAVQQIQRGNAVIALGAGAVLDPDNVERLQDLGELVYLQASADTIRHRILRGETPAFLTDEVSFAAMIRERKPIYESIPATHIDVDALDEAAVLAALRNLIIFEEDNG